MIFAGNLTDARYSNPKRLTRIRAYHGDIRASIRINSG
jgi:hypothetical protein